MMYRVNYGNGQVSEGFKTKREAYAYIAGYNRPDDRAGSFRVQFQDQDTGEWFFTGVR